jgi:serine/threonine protein kinase
LDNTIATILAKDFIAKLIERDPGKRMSAGEALAHPWITLDKERLEQQCYEIVGPFKESTDYVNLVSQREQDNHNSDIMQEDTVTPMDEEKKINPALHAQPSGRSGAARKTQPPPAPGTLRTVMTRSKARGMAEADAASASKRLRPNA